MKTALLCATLALLPACKRSQTVPQTQQAMDADAEGAFKRADQQLNAVYGAIVPRLEEDDRAKLAATERTWLAYRDSNCDAETNLYDEGSIAPQIRFACLATMTNARVGELKRVYEEQLGTE